MVSSEEKVSSGLPLAQNTQDVRSGDEQAPELTELFCFREKKANFLHAVVLSLIFRRHSNIIRIVHHWLSAGIRYFQSRFFNGVPLVLSGDGVVSCGSWVSSKKIGSPLRNWSEVDRDCQLRL